jgi:hypothetical protein
VHVSLSAAPVVRFNPSTGSTSAGYGAAMRFEVGRNAHVRPLIGMSFATVSLDDIGYTVVSAELGASVRLGKLQIIGAYAPCLYMASGTSDMTTDIASGFYFATDYRLGRFSLGSGVRVLTGPALWWEPAYLSVRF